MSRSATRLRERRAPTAQPDGNRAPSTATTLGFRTADVAQHIANADAGEMLPNEVQARLGQSFGHDFSQLRVHDDASADALAHTLDARAFAAGDDLFFRSGQYAPETSEGLRLVAHEAAHVASNQARGVAGSYDGFEASSLDVVASDDASEQVAHHAANAVIRGESVGSAKHEASSAASAVSSSAPSVVVQRWPWDDDTPAAPAAPAAANDVSAPASGLTSMLSSVGGAIGGAASSAYNFEKNALTTDYNAVKSASNWWDKTADLNADADKNPAWYDPTAGLRGFHKNFDTMGAGLKSGVADAASWADDATKGNSFLNGVANTVGGIANSTASIGAGAIEGVGDLATTTMNTFLHPVDSAAGMAGGIWDMWEHTPVIGSGFKMLHGAKDIATGNEHGAYGNNWSDLNKNLSPGNSIDNDIDFWAGIGGGRDAWAKDPLEAGTRTLTNFAPLILGAAEGIGGGGERPWDPSQPVDLEVRNSNPDLVRQPDPNTQPARRPGQFFNDPLPQKQGPSELDQIRVKVAEQRGGGAEFSKKNARRR